YGRSKKKLRRIRRIASSDEDSTHEDSSSVASKAPGSSDSEKEFESVPQDDSSHGVAQAVQQDPPALGPAPSQLVLHGGGPVPVASDAEQQLQQQHAHSEQQLQQQHAQSQTEILVQDPSSRGVAQVVQHTYPSGVQSQQGPPPSLRPATSQ